jgi:XTP/dITP diphosphohydrolase
MKLIIASNNEHKIREIKAILQDRFREILSMEEAGLLMDIEETGVTFRENALIKARAVAEASGCAALADDSGLMVDALNGAPGVYSARYCGVHGNDEANNDKLLERMAGVPAWRRGAGYWCAMALVRPGMEDRVAEGSCRGRILEQRRGSGGFGYDPLFYLPEFDCTMAQLTPGQKNAISHRYRALVKLEEMLEEEQASCSGLD